MITLYIWARDEKEAVEEIRYTFGCDNLRKVRNLTHDENHKIFEVIISAKEIAE